MALACGCVFTLPMGQLLLPEWASTLVYVPPSRSMYFRGEVVWALSMLFTVYTPRRIVFWFEEFQRVLFSHTVATLTFAGVLYLAKELPRLTFAYFFVLAIVLLIGYRVLLLWFRLRRASCPPASRALIVGAGVLGGKLVEEFDQQHWSSLEVIGYVDGDQSKQQRSIDGIPVLGFLDDAVVRKRIISTKS